MNLNLTNLISETCIYEYIFMETAYDFFWLTVKIDKYNRRARTYNCFPSVNIHAVADVA